MCAHTRFAVTSIAVLTIVGLAASCGDAADGAPGATPQETAPPADPDDHGDHDPAVQTVTIEGVDYHFDNVPNTIATGSRLSLDNTSATELHELVVFRLPDDVDTPLSELIGFPPEELEATLGAPVAVLLRPPGAPEPILAVGDGHLDEPGRYALMCFIPIGADPDEYLAAAAAAQGEAPTGVAGGPPHFTAGMFAELVVE